MANNNESWTGSKLGNCTQIPFDKHTKKVGVTILKEGSKDPLDILSLSVVGTSGSETITFQCGAFEMKASDRVKANTCLEEKVLKQFIENSKSLPRLTFTEIEVEMGSIGSDEDMRIKICDINKCCTTRVLSHLLGSEWKAHRNETWSGRKLGNCSEILFIENSLQLNVTLIKEGSGVGPTVSRLFLRGHVDSDKTNIRSFHCGSFELVNESQQSKSCINEFVVLEQQTVSSTDQKLGLTRVTVQVGPDGTDDDVSLTVKFAHF